MMMKMHLNRNYICTATDIMCISDSGFFMQLPVSHPPPLCRQRQQSQPASQPANTTCLPWCYSLEEEGRQCTYTWKHLALLCNNYEISFQSVSRSVPSLPVTVGRWARRVVMTMRLLATIPADAVPGGEHGAAQMHSTVVGTK